jgi:hypothetical protein
VCQSEGTIKADIRAIEFVVLFFGIYRAEDHRIACFRKVKTFSFAEVPGKS